MSSPIEGFVKKYRAAVAAKSKDIRISIEEAADIIGAFAVANTSNKSDQILAQVLAELKNLKSSSGDGSMDGGTFR